mgnify:CR=1 FL=1
MKFRRKARENVEINLASLIDVVFILLLFFVVTTTFTRETQLKVDLPVLQLSLLQTEKIGVRLPEILLETLLQHRAKTVHVP